MLSTLRLSRCSRLILTREKYARGLGTGIARCNQIEDAFPPRDVFETRHIGPRDREQAEMLKFLGIKVITFFSTPILHTT